MRPPHLAHLVSLAALLLLPPGCRDPGCGLEVCDIRAPACQQRLALATACAHGSEAPQAPVRVIAKDQYLAEARARAAQLDPGRFARLAGGLSLFQLAPSPYPLAQAVEQTSWAAAYYDPGKREIVIVDDGSPLDAHPQVTLLVHEYTHAIQHQRGAIGPAPTTTDQMLAERASREGEAVLTQDLAELALFGDDAGAVPWTRVMETWKEHARASMRAADAPLFVADLLFAYPFGTALTHESWEAQGRPALLQAVAAPRQTSRQVMAGLTAAEPGGGEWLESLDEVAIPELPSTFERLAQDRLGSWLLEAYLARVHRAASPAVHRAWALRLRGDSFSIHDDPQSLTTVAAWRLRFESEPLASEVLAGLRPHLPPYVHASLIARDLVLVASNSPTWLQTTAPGLRWMAAPPVQAPGMMAPAPHGCPARPPR